jgi:hypothetical protein
MKTHAAFPTKYPNAAFFHLIRSPDFAKQYMEYQPLSETSALFRDPPENLLIILRDALALPVHVARGFLLLCTGTSRVSFFYLLEGPGLPPSLILLEPVLPTPLYW